MANFFDQADPPAGNFFDQVDEAPSANFFDQADEGQGVMTTAGNALVSGAVDLVAKPFQALRNVQRSVSDLGQKYGGAPGRVLADAVMGGLANRALVDVAANRAGEVRAATQQAFPVDSERNPIAATVGGVVPQVASMIGAGLALGPAAPLALAATSEAQTGFETADQIGLTSPEARLAMAGGFAGMGAAIERMGGIGAKQAAGNLLRRSLAGAASETIEEPLTGVGQDLMTAAMATPDPNNPGFTANGFDLTQLDPRSPEYQRKRLMEGVGGLVGGTMFAGVNALTSPRGPAPDQPPPLPTDATPPGNFFDQADETVSPLPGIAQRAGTVDVAPLVPGLEAEDSTTPSLPSPPPASVTEGLESAPGDNTVPNAIDAGSTPAAGAPSPLQSSTTPSLQSPDATAATTPTAPAPAPPTPPAAPTTEGQSPAAEAAPVVETSLPQLAGASVAAQPAINARQSVAEPVPQGQQSLYQIRATQGRPLTDDNDVDSNWRELVFSDSVELVSSDGTQRAVFPVSDRASYGDQLRARMKAQIWAAENPIARQQSEAAPMQADYGGGRIEDVTVSTPQGFKNLDTSGTTAGFLNTDIINEAADLIRRGFTNFADWSRAMVTRFGQRIRDYLQAIWQQVTNPPTNAARNVRMGAPQGTAPVGIASGGFIPNPLHKQGDAFRVKAQIGRALLTGSPLPKGFIRVLDATENERRAVDQTAAMVGRDLQAAVEAYAKRTGKPLAEVWARVEPVMTGQPGGLMMLNLMDANLGERARRARNLLDDLSTAVARTMPAGEMRNTILGNLGQWMRRGYAAFDAESGWNFDKVTEAAKAGKLIAGKNAAQILADARAYLRTQNPTATAAEIEADMRDLMDRDTWQSALLGGTVKKAVGSLMRRKDIAPEIRALMGEETNPLHRYLQSAKFQAQLIARHHGQVAMRTIGLSTGLLKPARGGVYTVEIPKDGYRWSGLGGTWTTPELMQALENSSGILQDGNSWGGWLVKTLKALGNEAKLNRVALNPDSWLVNVLGGFVSLVQGGDVFATSVVRRIREAGGTIGSGKTAATASALQDAQRALLSRLTEQGVIGSSITLADIEASLPRHLLQWVAENQARDRTLGAAQGALIGQSMGRGLGLPGRAVGGAVGAVGGALAGTQNLQKWRQKVAEWTMTKPDNLFRVTGWLTNYETALASGMQTEAAAKWASERTLNTYPNYNALPAVLREFSKLGLVGSFIAFQHEVYRNTYWNVRYAVREVASGNAALQARGLQRLAGLTSIAALTFGGGLATILGMSGAAGADDERNKLFRKWFAAPWEKDAVLAFDRFSPTSVSYLNTSYLLPQVTIQELAQAASEGAPEGEVVQRVMGRLWEQFAGSSVHLSPIINAMMNVDRTGRAITNRPGVAGALDRVDSAVSTIAEPGFAEKMTRIAYAMREAERRGRKFSVEQEIKRVFGLRGIERNWDVLVKSRYSRFGAEYQAIREDANRVLGENLPGARTKAIEEANKRIAELDAQRVMFEAAMTKMGIDPKVIRAAKRDSAFNALNPVKVRKDGRRVESAARR